MPALSEKVQQRAVAAAAYVMPKPRSGIVVWHFADRSGDMASAIVTKVTRETIDVAVFAEGGGLMTRTGVRHIDDPRLKTMTEPNPGGVFELTEFERVVNSLLAADKG